jgi:uncharacterized delta-60 repeat protein
MVAVIGSDGMLDGGFKSPFISNLDSPVVNSAKSTLAGNQIIVGGSGLGPGARNDVIRLNLDGSIDASFNASSSSADFSGAQVTRLYPDVQGGMLIAHGANNQIIRLTATGSRDAGFTPALVGSDWIFGPQQADRKILYLALNLTGNTSRQLRRMNPDGTDDATYPVISTPYASNYEITMPILQDDGTIYVGPVTATRKAAHLEISHVLINGSIDVGFNPRISNYGSVSAYTRFPDGKLLLAGTFDYINNTSFLGTNGMTVTRLNKDGTVDSSFIVTLPSTPGNGSGVDQAAVQSDGKTILVGSFPDTNGYRSIIRLGVDGSIDPSFGPFPQSLLYAAAMDASGDFYGYRGETGARLQRYSSAGVLDSSFQAPDLGLIKFIVPLASGAVLVYGSADGFGLHFTRLLQNGAIDPQFSPPGNTKVVAVAALPDGNALFCEELNSPQVAGSYYHTIRRLLSDGTIDYKYTSPTTSGIGPREDIRLGLAKAVFDLLNQASPAAEAEVTVDFSSSEELMKLSCRTDGTLLINSFVSRAKPIQNYQLTGLATSSKSLGDFNGDGKADLVWTNKQTGDRSMWFLNGDAMSGGASLGVVPVAWTASATADFDGDGKVDIFWTNTVTGDRAMWLMDGSTTRTNAFMGSVPVDWVISGTGDFDGDGKKDLVWTNTTTGDRAMWLMNGSTVTGGGYLGAVPVEWTISGVGDFDGDGKADLIWSNRVTGERSMWFQNGSTTIGGATLNTVPVAWVISGVGDFNGDGKADVFLTNTVSGDRVIWLMNGSTLSTNAFMGTVPVEWTVSGTGDFNGDGRKDIFWTNTVTGDRAMWLLNGATAIGGGFMGTVSVVWTIN